MQAIIPAPEIFFMMNPSFNGFNKLQLFCCYWQIEVAKADVITITIIVKWLLFGCCKKTTVIFLAFRMTETGGGCI
jgi:hypothetical protein